MESSFLGLCSLHFLFHKAEGSSASLGTVCRQHLLLQSWRSSSWEEPKGYFLSEALGSCHSDGVELMCNSSFGRSFPSLICSDTVWVYATRLLPICTSTCSESSPLPLILITINKRGATMEENGKGVGFLHEEGKMCRRLRQKAEKNKICGHQCCITLTLCYQ